MRVRLGNCRCFLAVVRAEVVRVCVKPPDVAPNVNEWAHTPGAKAVWTTSRARFTVKSQGLTIYVFDLHAPLASAKRLPIPYNKLTCPTPPPRPEPSPPKDPTKTPAEERQEGASTSAEASASSKPPPAKDEQAEVVPPGVKKMPERPPEKPRPAPPPPEGVLSNEPQLPSEGVLPKRDEVHPPKCVDPHCTLVDRGGALPELQHGQGRPLVSAVPCEQTKEGCARPAFPPTIPALAGEVASPGRRRSLCASPTALRTSLTSAT